MDWNTFEDRIASYLRCYPDEAERVRLCLGFLGQNIHEQRIDRNNHRGHLTASAFLVNEGFDQLMMIHHKRLDRWLQPGGHVDGSDSSLLAAAKREVHEETGLPIESLQLHDGANCRAVSTPVSPATAGSLVSDLGDGAERIPFDIDSHWIPPNSRRQEPGHYHHDVRFLFVIAGDAEVSPAMNEVSQISWFPLDIVNRWDGFTAIVSKLNESRP